MKKKRLLILIGSAVLALALVMPLVAACAPAAPEAPTLGGGVANLKGLNEGTQDIGLTQGLSDALGWAGEAPFEKQYRDARSMFVTYPNIFHGYALKKSGIKTLEDAIGKRISAGKKGFTSELMWGILMKELGITYDDFTKVELVGYNEGATLMKDGHLDFYWLVTFPPSAPFLEVDAFSPVEVIVPSPEVVARIVENYPGFVTAKIAGGIYREIPNDLTTVATPCGFSARKDLPEDVVYKIVKAWWEDENYQRSWAVNPGFKDFIKPENALAGLAMPLHLGAYKYYKEKGYDIPEALMPID